MDLSSLLLFLSFKQRLIFLAKSLLYSGRSFSLLYFLKSLQSLPFITRMKEWTRSTKFTLQADYPMELTRSKSSSRINGGWYMTAISFGMDTSRFLRLIFLTLKERAMLSYSQFLLSSTQDTMWFYSNSPLTIKVMQIRIRITRV